MDDPNMHTYGEHYKLPQQLGMATVDAIANDGCRNAAGGIYATRVQEFVLEDIELWGADTEGGTTC